MADTKISALPSATTPLVGSEVLPIVQGGTTDKVSVANLTAGRAVSALSYSAGNLRIAGNAITSSSGAVDLRPASSGFATIGAAASTSWASSFYGLSGGDFYSVSTDGSNSNTVGFASNAYRTASGSPGTWKYAAGANATLYNQYIGGHYFYGAVSGNANGTISWIPQLSIAQAGDVTINTGNLIQGTAAKGVNFTANTPAAGMTSQLLNWYEEGTWTPDLLIAGGNTGITYTSRSGRYTRNGRLVEVECSVVLSSKGARTGVVRVGGLPFTPGIDVLPATIVPTGTWASLVAGGSIQAYISGTAVYLLLGTTTGTTGLTDVNLSNTSAFTFTATFSV